MHEKNHFTHLFFSNDLSFDKVYARSDGKDFEKEHILRYVNKNVIKSF